MAVLPKQAAYNQPLLIPALLVLLAHREGILKGHLFSRALAKGVSMCLIWQWGTAFVLGLGSLLLSPSRIQFAAGVPEYTLLAFPPMTLLAIVMTSFSLGNVGSETLPDNLFSPQTPAGPHE
jgi:hypothetical protein